jgi:outer membrane protein OmpA-like peptidoglycan-associated protein
VKKYLLSHKIAARRIIVCAGIGEVRRTGVPDTKDGYPEDRRVAIFLQRTPAITKAKPKSGIKVTELPPEEAPESTQPVPKPTRPVAIPKTVNAVTAQPPLANNRFEQLAEMEVNEVMRIESIHFQPTRHFITKESEPILGALYVTLLHHPGLKIRIEGHVCCIQAGGDALDTDTREFNLSENRARYIYDYLVAKGIDKDRLEYAGFGKQRPVIAVERTEEDAVINRRVEFRVLAN